MVSYAAATVRNITLIRWSNYDLSTEKTNQILSRSFAKELEGLPLVFRI